MMTRDMGGSFAKGLGVLGFGFCVLGHLILGFTIVRPRSWGVGWLDWLAPVFPGSWGFYSLLVAAVVLGVGAVVVACVCKAATWPKVLGIAATVTSLLLIGFVWLMNQMPH